MAIGLIVASPVVVSAQTSIEDALRADEAARENTAPANIGDKALTSYDSGQTQRFRLTVGDRVFFAQSSADLGLRAGLALEAQAKWLIATGSKAVVVGHADDGGSTSQDRTLGQQRAAAVRQRLIDNGVPPQRLQVLSVGNTQPVAVCPDTICRIHNRRVETVIVKRLEASQ
ncbi:MAG: OmpA family protein [Filomicrobium sp.]